MNLRGKTLAQTNRAMGVLAKQVAERIAEALRTGQPIKSTDDIDGAAYAALFCVSMMRQRHLGLEKDIHAECHEALELLTVVAEGFELAADRETQKAH